jgi:hypothetical protein
MQAGSGIANVINFDQFPLSQNTHDHAVRSNRCSGAGVEVRRRSRHQGLFGEPVVTRDDAIAGLSIDRAVSCLVL